MYFDELSPLADLYSRPPTAITDVPELMADLREAARHYLRFLARMRSAAGKYRVLLAAGLVAPGPQFVAFIEGQSPDDLADAARGYVLSGVLAHDDHVFTELNVRV